MGAWTPKVLTVQGIRTVLLVACLGSAIAFGGTGCSSEGLVQRLTPDGVEQAGDEDYSPADGLPPPAEPWLAEGGWEADFNDLQVACYEGSMPSCDDIWLSERVLTDTWLHMYGYLCGGRIDDGSGVTDSSDRMRYRLYDMARCTEIFPS